METLNIILSLFAGAILLLNTFANKLDHLSLPAPLLALLFGTLVGPHALSLLDPHTFGVPGKTLLEEAARITLAIGLVGVALRLPHGYWKQNWRWIVAIVGIGMFVMWIISATILWALLGIPLLLALLIGAVITPTDPITTTPIVTGPSAEENIPQRVRSNISAESGINDGLAYLFVFLPVLLLLKPSETAWSEWVTHTLLWEVVVATVVGAAAGYLLAKLFVFAKKRGYMEKTSYFGFMAPMALLLLGSFKLLGTDAILAVFVAAAVFGRTIPQADESEEDTLEDTFTRFFIIPIFILLGISLPITEWTDLGPLALLTITAALFFRRFIGVWLLRPLFRSLHTKAETLFLGWFGAIGVSALYYATLAERKTGNAEIFLYVTFAITISLLVHGLSTVPFGKWLKRSSSKN